MYSLMVINKHLAITSGGCRVKTEHRTTGFYIFSSSLGNKKGWGREIQNHPNQRVRGWLHGAGDPAWLLFHNDVGRDT